MNCFRLLVAALSLAVGFGLVACSDHTAAPAADKAAEKAKPEPTPEEVRAEQIKKLEARVAQSDAQAALDLAKVLMDGTDSPPNYERAKDLLTEASQKGLAEATFGLYGLSYWGIFKDDKLPTKEQLKAKIIASGDPLANLLWFSFFFSPYDIFDADSEPPPAVIKLADSGHALANARMATYYSAQALHSQSCELDKQFAQVTTTPISPSDAIRCVRLAKLAAQFPRALDHATKAMSAQDADADTVRYWTALHRRIVSAKRRADLNPLTQMRFSHVYPKEDGYATLLADGLTLTARVLAVNKRLANPGLTAQLYKRAAELGDSDAQNAVGELFRDGKGVAKDYEMAARYFAQSAQQADGDGTKNMGLAYGHGKGVDRNAIQAYFWLNVSAQSFISIRNSRMPERILSEAGDPAYLRDKLAKSMSAAEVAEAQRLSREWRPSYQAGPPPELTPATAAAGAGGAQSKQAKTKAQTGTVFVVSKEGHAITNHHVVDGCAELRIEGRDTVVSKLTSDPVNDLALIQWPGPVSDVAKITAEPGKLRQGEDIIVFGFPLKAVLSSGGNLTPGVVSALTGLANNTNQIQITAPIQPGSSGSPVLNKRGEVVGVVSMKLSDAAMAKATGSVGQNVNFAVGGQTLRSFLETHKVPFSTGGGFFSRDRNAADIADDARKFTLVVECWK